MHNNIQEVCGTSRLVTALALTYRWGSMGFDRFIDFLPDAKHLSAVDKSAFADTHVFSVSLHVHLHNCSVQARSSV